MALSTSWYDVSPSNIQGGEGVISGYHIKQMHPVNSTSYDSRLNYGILPYLLSLGLLINNQLKENSREYISEGAGPFRTVYEWKQVDYLFESEVHRNVAIANGEFVQENNLPLGIEIYKNRLFVSMPVWKSGVPATLTVLPIKSKEKSPLLAPYPNWSWHKSGSCNTLTSVFRMQADICGRLWVLDSGQVNIANDAQQICPPSIFIFNLTTDNLILKYDLPEDSVKQDSLYSNIIVDVRDGQCDTAHAYLADVWRFGLVVFSFKEVRSWRITDHLFFPDPLAASYEVNGLEFQWTDGIFGFALSPFTKRSIDRTLYFNPMTSFRQFYTKASIICNETGWSQYKDAFQVYGQSRGKKGQASSCVMDKNAILFFGMVTQNAIGCWDSRKPYKRKNLALVAQNNKTIIFPNDLKVDNEKRQKVFIISNKLPFFIYGQLNASDVNFRIMAAYTDEAVKGTICDPAIRYKDTYKHDYEECI